MTVVKAFFSMAACLPLAPLAPAESLPPGTAIAVRIDTKITSGAKAGDKVEAVVVAPVLNPHSRMRLSSRMSEFAVRKS